MKHLVVVGAGVVGLSVSRAAVKEGYRVTLIEQGPIPNPHSASYDQHRMIRYQYGAAEGYTRMVGDAFGAWDRLWADLGVKLFHDSGALAISLSPDDSTTKSLKTFQKLGISHQVLDRDGVEQVCPQLTLPDGAWGLLAATGGPLYAGRIVEALAQWLVGKTIDMRTDSKVVKVDRASASVILEDGSSILGDHLVIAAGAWLGDLSLDASDVPSYRQALCYVEPPEAYADAWLHGPCISDLGPGGNYALPPTDGNGLKFGSGSYRRLGKPSDGFQSDLALEGAQILANFAPFLRQADHYRPVRIQVGYYVRDVSRRFRIEQHGRTTLVTNCDGQMFKFGPLVGERVLGCLEGRQASSDLSRWAAGY
ncbi:hypothetical protein EOS_37925 [Caballeronia mineralivorans PML1(12)]|uniref:FAD dependent oxidoreductase domain-containing protein n=1 Tax=Caballeronia mineralivorans PML1(12) TaxID=908627 RepID=A0A0J1CKV4_9BURK|nr:FAD-dependent oxidoreductase [Caballeronia mineralivorans]KLU21051.1 hypothetical protein EOS_37925 [Caballeronia mineralivorans PML1(12)]